MSDISKTAQSFIDGKATRCHNAVTNGKQYLLHSTVICEKQGNKYVFNWGGYYTNTTANHMNFILSLLGKPRISYAKHRKEDVSSFTVEV